MSKQTLTSSQIQQICDAIPINRSLPEHIRLSISSRIRTRLYNDLCRVQIYPQLFSSFKEEIVKYYYRTLAPSGEAVGVQVAQSIGERQTQNTLNSIDWEDMIILSKNEECIVEPVGKFIDEFLEKEKEKIEYIEENRTQYLDLSSLSYDVKMPSVDENGHTEWLKVEALTRHLPVGKLVKVKTHFGREVTATQSKSFLVWDSSVEKFIDKNGSDLKVGDYLPTTLNLSRVGDQRILSTQTLPSIFLDHDFGWIVGAYLSDCGKDHLQGRVEKWSNRTNISIISLYHTLKNIFHDIKNKKKVPLISYTANQEFQYGLLEGFFSCDAVFNNDEMIVLNNKDVIYGIGFILSYFGIFVKYEKDTETDDYRLVIKHTKNIEEFKQSLNDNKNKVYDNKKDVVFDQIVSIDYVEPTKEYVYDFTVEKTRNFIIFNGLGVRDTFHSSGLSIKTVVVGVPRFSELLNATRSPKMVNCLLYLNEPFDDVSHVRRRSGNMFTDMTIRRLLKSSELIKDEPLEDWHHLFCDLYEVNRGILGWRLRLHIDKDVLYEYQVTTKMIAQSIMNEYGDAIVLHTPDWVGIIDVFVDEGCFTKLEKEKEKVEKEDEIEEPEEEEEEEDEEDEDGDVEVGVDDNGDDKDGDEKDEDIKDTTELPIPIRKNDDGKKDVIPEDIDRVIHMEDKVLPSILDIRVCGVEGVKDIFFEKRKEEWIITTEGSNLYHLFANPLIDKTRSMSNDMWEIYEIFGIEAARQFLIEEYMDIVSSDGTFVNASNVELLVDIMVYTGTIISISRYGQKKVGCGPMAKASFEESLENFLKAGVNGEKESANGVSASIMLGKMPNIGTGVFDLLVDVPKLLSMSSMSSNIDKNDIKNDKNDIKNNKKEKDIENNENKEESKYHKEEKKEKIIEIQPKSIFQKF